MTDGLLNRFNVNSNTLFITVYVSWIKQLYPNWSTNVLRNVTNLTYRTRLQVLFRHQWAHSQDSAAHWQQWTAHPTWYTLPTVVHSMTQQYKFHTSNRHVSVRSGHIHSRRFTDYSKMLNSFVVVITFVETCPRAKQKKLLTAYTICWNQIEVTGSISPWRWRHQEFSKRR